MCRRTPTSKGFRSVRAAAWWFVICFRSMPSTTSRLAPGGGAARRWSRRRRRGGGAPGGGAPAARRTLATGGDGGRGDALPRVSATARWPAASGGGDGAPDGARGDAASGRRAAEERSGRAWRRCARCGAGGRGGDNTVYSHSMACVYRSGADRHASACRRGRTRSLSARWLPIRCAAPMGSSMSRPVRRASRRSRSAVRTIPPGPGDTPSRRRLLVCTPTSAADEEPCARQVLSTLAHPRLSPPGRDERTRADDAARVLSRRTPVGHVRCGHTARAGPCARRPGIPVPLRARAGQYRAWRRLPSQRPRARVAAVVLPVEQCPGRRVDRPGGARRPAGSEGAGAAGPPDARRPARRGAGVELRRTVALSSRVEECASRVGRLRRQPARVDAARDRAAVPHRAARGSQRHRFSRRRLHVRRRAAGAPLRSARHPRRADAPRHAAGRQSATRVCSATPACSR